MHAPRPSRRWRISVDVFEARDLVNTQSFGHQDPYCIISCGGQHKKTPVDENGGTRPVWGSTKSGVQLDFDLRVDAMDALHTIDITVKNSNVLKDKVIGRAAVLVSTLQDYVPHHQWFELSRNGRPAGEVRVCFHILQPLYSSGPALPSYIPPLQATPTKPTFVATAVPPPASPTRPPPHGVPPPSGHAVRSPSSTFTRPPVHHAAGAGHAAPPPYTGGIAAPPPYSGGTAAPPPHHPPQAAPGHRPAYGTSPRDYLPAARDPYGLQYVPGWRAPPRRTSPPRPARSFVRTPSHGAMGQAMLGTALSSTASRAHERDDAALARRLARESLSGGAHPLDTNKDGVVSVSDYRAYLERKREQEAKDAELARRLAAGGSL